MHRRCLCMSSRATISTNTSIGAGYILLGQRFVSAGLAIAFPHTECLSLFIKLKIASPYRLVQFAKAAYYRTRTRLRDTHTQFTMGTLRASLFDRNLFRRIAFPTSLSGTLAAIDTSLHSLCRHEIEMNLSRLHALRETQAACLGLLFTKGIDLDGRNEWKEDIVRGVDMMKSTMEWLQNVDVQSEPIERFNQCFTLMNKADSRRSC